MVGIPAAYTCIHSIVQKIQDESCYQQLISSRPVDTACIVLVALDIAAQVAGPPLAATV